MRQKEDVMVDHTVKIGGMKLMSDMSFCQPSTGLTRESKDGSWSLAGYEAEGVTGTMIC
jgi:hypothetical protein